MGFVEYCNSILQQSTRNSKAAFLILPFLNAIVILQSLFTKLSISLKQIFHLRTISTLCRDDRMCSRWFKHYSLINQHRFTTFQHFCLLLKRSYPPGDTLMKDSFKFKVLCYITQIVQTVLKWLITLKLCNLYYSVSNGKS